jgi:hypothetical protein
VAVSEDGLDETAAIAERRLVAVSVCVSVSGRIDLGNSSPDSASERRC